MYHRRTLGERLAHLGVAVLRRKRCAAWSKWAEETRLWMEEQLLVRVKAHSDFLELCLCSILHEMLSSACPREGRNG